MALHLRVAKIEMGTVVLGRKGIFYNIAQVPEPPSSLPVPGFCSFLLYFGDLLVYLKQLKNKTKENKKTHNKKLKDWKPSSLISLATSQRWDCRKIRYLSFSCLAVASLGLLPNVYGWYFWGGGCEGL